MKRIAILGSTGSIGTQALEVVTAHPDQFKVMLLTAQNNTELLAAQARQFKPENEDDLTISKQIQHGLCYSA